MKEQYEVSNIDLPTRLLNAVEVARLLNISRAFAYRLMQQGQIRTVTIGTARRVRLKDLEAFIEKSSSHS